MKILIVVAAVLCGCAGKPLDDYFRSVPAGDGQYVLKQDQSYERGVLETDWSLEYVRPYGGTRGTTRAGSVAGYRYSPFTSSEEVKYYLYNQGTQGAPRSVRVKALSESLNTGLLDLSDEYVLRHLNLKGSPKLLDGQYYVDASGELYYQPKQGGQAQISPGGAGTVTAKRK